MDTQYTESNCRSVDESISSCGR